MVTLPSDSTPKIIDEFLAKQPEKNTDPIPDYDTDFDEDEEDDVIEMNPASHVRVQKSKYKESGSSTSFVTILSPKFPSLQVQNKHRS